MRMFRRAAPTVSTVVVPMLLNALLVNAGGGCTSAPVPVRSDDGVGHSESSLTSAEFEGVAAAVAFDPDYVALELASIGVYRTLLANLSEMTPAEDALIRSGGATEAEVVAITGVNRADAARLRALGTRVRERFPWIATYGAELHTVALTTNPVVYAEFEAALRTVPAATEFFLAGADAAERSANIRGAMLAHVVADTEDLPPAAFVGARSAAVDDAAKALFVVTAALYVVGIGFLIASVAAGGNPVLGGIGLVLLGAAVVIGLVAANLDDIVNWFENFAEDVGNVVEEIFGEHDDECEHDEDCPENQWCDKGDVLGGLFGDNECVGDKGESEACWDHDECISDCCRVYLFKMQCRPSSKCD